MDQKWNEKTILEKIAVVVSGIGVFVWLLFEALERMGVVQGMEMVSNIAVSVICVCEAFSFWKVNRKISYIAIGGLALIIAVMVLQAI